MKYIYIFDSIKFLTLLAGVFSPYHQCSHYLFYYPIGFLCVKYCITTDDYLFFMDDLLSVVTVCIFYILELIQCNYFFYILLMIYFYIIFFYYIIFSCFYQDRSIDINIDNTNTNTNIDIVDISPNIDTISVYINDLHLIDTPEIDDWICVICLEDSTDNTIRFKCGHYYHKTCIAEWNKINNLCPICKCSLQIPDISNNIDNHVLCV